MIDAGMNRSKLRLLRTYTFRFICTTSLGMASNWRVVALTCLSLVVTQSSELPEELLLCLLSGIRDSCRSVRNRGYVIVGVRRWFSNEGQITQWRTDTIGDGLKMALQAPLHKGQLQVELVFTCESIGTARTTVIA